MPQSIAGRSSRIGLAYRVGRDRGTVTVGTFANESNDLAPVSHERRDDFVPFRRQFMRRWFASRLSIPIIGIIQVAFDAVEVGVHPSAILIVSIHNDAMRFVPILVRRPPHGLQGRRCARRRRFRFEGLLESRQGHAQGKLLYRGRANRPVLNTRTASGQSSQ